MNGSADSGPRVYFVHPLLAARDWQDRPEFDDLCQWWRDGGRGVCGLVGIGGAGKTAVAERFLRALPGLAAPGPQLEADPPLPTPQGLFVFSFYDAPNPEVFFDALYDWLLRTVGLADRRRVTEGGQRLQAPAPLVIEALNNLGAAGGRLLLVLDGIEKVQDDGSRGGTFGHIEDGGLRAIVLYAAGGWMPHCSVLVTTRFVPDDLEYERDRGSAPFYERIEVDQISDEACIALLRRRGVRGPDDALREVARQCGRHALTVDLAATYLVQFCQGDPHAPLEMPTAEELQSLAERTRDRRLRYMVEQSERFAKLARRYHAALGRSDAAALALLERICLFRLGVTADTLVAVFTGPDKTTISGPELARLSRDQLDAKLNVLVEMRLIESHGERRPKEPQSEIRNLKSEIYSVHPAVRDGFLAALDAATARLSHEAVRRGLEALLGERAGPNPSGPATLDLLEEIVHHAIQAGHAQEAWGIYWSRIGTYENLGWRLGAYERGERICRAFARGRPPETAPLPDGLSEHHQVVFINEWALYLGNLGRLDAAAHCFQRGNEPDCKKENWKGASRGNQNLAEVWLLAGRLSGALRAADEALQLAERADEAEERCYSYAYRAHARALRGETAAALADFRDALHWQHEDEGETDRPLYSNRGYWHTLLLARLGRTEEATQFTEANKAILLDAFGAQDSHVPSCNLILADLARQRGDLPEVEQLLQEAHTWALARDAKEPLCWAELVRARIELKKGTGSEQPGRGPRENASRRGACPLFQRPECVAAGRALEHGLRIARDCGFGIYHIDLLLERARWHLVAGEAEAAEADLRTALFDGHTPPPDTGLPTLLAATDPECGYAWGIAEGRHLLGETLLLKAAQKLRKSQFTPASLDQLPAAVRELIAQGRKELKSSLDLWRNLKDPESDAEINPHGQPTRRRLKQLSGGLLTVYPRTPARPLSPVKPPRKRKSDVPTHQFNRNRLRQLEELLDIEYEKLYGFEKELDLATGAGERVAIRQQIKRQIVPRLRDNEREYAELLAAGVPDEDIPEEEAASIVAQLFEATTKTAESGQASEQMLKLLGDIQQKLNEPGRAAGARLKTSLPIIPLLVSYELELDTENFIAKVWRKARDVFSRLVHQNPQ